MGEAVMSPTTHLIAFGVAFAVGFILYRLGSR